MSLGNAELPYGVAALQEMAWMGKEWEEALGITITEVVFKAMSVRSADSSHGGREHLLKDR